jgi:hypothetical protein
MSIRVFPNTSSLSGNITNKEKEDSQCNMMNKFSTCCNLPLTILQLSVTQKNDLYYKKTSRGVLCVFAMQSHN